MLLFHWTPEGTCCEIGFNFRGTWKGRCSFTVIWCNYTPNTYSTSGWRLRVCFRGRPHFYYERFEPHSVIETYLFEHNWVTISKEVYADLVKGRV